MKTRAHTDFVYWHRQIQFAASFTKPNKLNTLYIAFHAHTKRTFCSDNTFEKMFSRIWRDFFLNKQKNRCQLITNEMLKVECGSVFN